MPHSQPSNHRADAGAPSSQGAEALTPLPAPAAPVPAPASSSTSATPSTASLAAAMAPSMPPRSTEPPTHSTNPTHGDGDDNDATRVFPTPVRAPQAGGVSKPLEASARPSPAEATLPGALPGTLPGNLPADDPLARQVGRYLIRERLGRGGMATVFRAHDPGIGRDVAIKFLHASLCEDVEYRGRFLREARAAGGLSHPNIVTVHDVGEIDGRPYMAMELLDGVSLADLMGNGRALPVRDVVVIGIQLARALHFAHAHGIVHRDIKPGNIARLKGTNTIKVMDFGIAHMEEASSSGEQRTRVGDILGTPQYMSPEQTQGQVLDGRSDLFSVGIIFYQMLTGQRPFQGDSLVALAMKIVKDEAPAIEKLRPDVPAALRRIVERCLAKQPDRRFQTGKELSEALSRVLAGLDEAERNKEKPRIVPLRVKWAATMALIVAVVMAFSATLITQRQYAAMMKQVTDNGASLARFIAAQNAGPALAEEWPTVDVAVQEIMKTGDFESITVVDRDGVVRASGSPALVGQPYQPPAAAELLGTRDGGVAMSRYSSAQGEKVLGFDTLITYQGKPVGRVALGLAERPLQRVARLSMGLMAALVVVTVLAVAVAMYFVTNWFARPIKLVGDALDEITRGRFDHRIAETRNDEFGLLFGAFDRMAQALQEARSSGGASMPTPTPITQRIRREDDEAGAPGEAANAVAAAPADPDLGDVEAPGPALPSRPAYRADDEPTALRVEPTPRDPSA